MRLSIALAALLTPLLLHAPAALAKPQKPVVLPVIVHTAQPTTIRHIRIKAVTLQYSGGE